MIVLSHVSNILKFIVIQLKIKYFIKILLFKTEIYFRKIYGIIPMNFYE